MRARLTPVAALAIAATFLGATASAQDSPPVPRTMVEDDVLQITLDRLVAEAPLFGSFAACEGVLHPCDAGVSAQISVIRLDNGERADVNGEAGQISYSAVKALWVTMAVAEVGTGAVGAYAPQIFRHSDDAAAGSVIDLMGHPPSDGVDAVNATTYGWGLTDTWLRGWYLGREASSPYPAGMGLWGRSNYTTTNDLAGFWAMLGRGELLNPPDTVQVLAWAALPRSDPGNELIITRLPAEVAAGAAHKAGWPDVATDRRIDGGLVTTPAGVMYSIAVDFKTTDSASFFGGAADWARYASCEVYNVIAGTDHDCTRRGDPESIRNHTRAPIGWLASASAERDRVGVTGWALDRDAGAEPMDVRVTVDGVTVGTVSADRLKTAIHSRHGTGNYHGFRAEFPTALSPGAHEVCAIGINDSGTGPDPTLGCKPVVVPEDYPPIGRLTRAWINGSSIVARGWAEDPDTGDPIRVKVTVDGNKVRTVVADRGARGHGFLVTLFRPLTPGEHTVCAVAYSPESGGPQRDLGCRTVTRPADLPPGGKLTGVGADATGVTVKGSASDPDTTDPIEVRVEMDGLVLGSLMADGGSSGFWYRGTLAAPLTPGSHTVCTFAVNHTGGGPIVELGCATVDVV